MIPEACPNCGAPVTLSGEVKLVEKYVAKVKPVGRWVKFVDCTPCKVAWMCSEPELAA